MTITRTEPTSSRSVSTSPGVISLADARAAAAVVNDGVLRAAADCEIALRRHQPAPARLSQCRSILYEQLGLDMSGRGWPARLLAFLLRNRSGPFTWAVGRLTGDTPRIETASELEYRLSGTEAIALNVLDEACLYAWRRDAIMFAGDTPAAAVQLRITPGRIGGWRGREFAAIRGGVPCGMVLPDLLRTDRDGIVDWPGGEVPVTGHAMLSTDAIPFGFSRECVTGALIDRLSGC
jgi:hypothetical protein